MARVIKPYQLKVFLSNRYAYAQIAKQVGGEHSIIASASTIEKGLQEGLESKADATACSKVGAVLAERAAAQGIQGVQWQRKRGQRFHGRVAALVTSLQEAGLRLV